MGKGETGEGGGGNYLPETRCHGFGLLNYPLLLDLFKINFISV